MITHDHVGRIIIANNQVAQLIRWTPTRVTVRFIDTGHEEDFAPENVKLARE